MKAYITLSKVGTKEVFLESKKLFDLYFLTSDTGECYSLKSTSLPFEASRLQAGTKWLLTYATKTTPEGKTYKNVSAIEACEKLTDFQSLQLQISELKELLEKHTAEVKAIMQESKAKAEDTSSNGLPF